MRFLSPLAIFFLASLLPAAEPAKKTDDASPVKVVELQRTEPVIYDKDIEPILAKRCQVCHSGNVKESHLDLSSYEGLMQGGKRGRNVVPGKSSDSLLVKVAGRTDKPLMPPPGEEDPLTPEELALLKLWIDQGAKAPTGARVRPRAVVTMPPAGVHPVRAVAISPDKALVASGRGNQIHLHDGKAGNHVRSLADAELQTPAAHLSLVESLAFSPDGKLLASGSYQEVKLWDVATGKLEKKIAGFADRVVALSFAPDGKLLATGGGAATEDGEIKIVEVPEGKVVADIKNGHSDTVFGVSFSPDGKLLAACSADKFVKVFDVPAGKLVKSFEGHTHHVLDVGWKGDGKVLASAGADLTIKVWNYETGEAARTIRAHNKQVTRMQFIGKTPQVVTCGGDQLVKIFNVDSGATVRTIPGSSDFLYTVSASADGSIVAAGGEEGVVRLYNGTNGQLIKALAAPAAETTPK